MMFENRIFAPPRNVRQLRPGTWVFKILLMFCCLPALEAQELSPHCAKNIQLASALPDIILCVGDTAEINLQLCISTETESSENVTVQFNLPEALEGVYFAGGDLDENNRMVIQHSGITTCINLTIFVSAALGIDSGLVLPLSYSVISPQGYCSLPDSITSGISILPVDCAASTCNCNHSDNGKEITGNVYLSEFINDIDPENPYECWAINGVLYVNTIPPPTFRIENAEIIMGPAAQIIISDRSSLILKNNTIFGCEKLWHSISKVWRGRLTLDNNVIEDGTFAIVAAPYVAVDQSVFFIPDINISNNDFRKNFISVFQSTLAGKVNYTAFAGNEFTCEGMSLLPAAVTSSFIPQPGSKSYSGVYIYGNAFGNSLPVLIGNNHFHHLQNGIIGFRADLIVKKSIFSNIPVNNEYFSVGFSSGHGIIMKSGGALAQTGYGKFSPISSFSDVRDAIKIVNPTGGISIKDNKMLGVKTGVTIQTGEQIPHAILSNNFISCDVIGIDLFDIFRANFHDISFNRIDLDDPQIGTPGPKGTGIRYNNAYADYSPISGQLFNNELNIRNTNQGIIVNASWKLQVMDNAVNLLGAIPFNGIGFYGSGQGFLHCNTITGISTDYDSYHNIGFNISNSIGTEYKCNTTENTGVGFRFAGVCGSAPPNMKETDFQANTITTHSRGLWMKEDAIFGSMASENVMEHRGNQWQDNFGEHRAIHEGAAAQILYSQFEVHTDNLPYYPRDNNPNNPSPSTPNATGVPWFSVDYYGSPDTCPVTCYPTGQPVSVPTQIGGLGLAIAADTLDFTDVYDESMRWTLKRHLYHTLDEYPDLQNQDGVLEDFYTGHNDSPIATFIAIDRLIAQANHWDSLSFTDFHRWEAAIQNRLDSIDATEAGLGTTPTLEEIEAAEQQVKQYLYEIDSFRLLQTGLTGEMKITEYALLDSAINLNNSVTVSADIESNEKALNALYLTKTARGQFDLTQAESDTMKTIAYQCPTIGGNSVFRARSILAANGYEEQHYDDDSLCQLAAQRHFFGVKPVLPAGKNLRVFPNPSQGSIFIQVFNQPESSSGKFVVSDMTGVICYSAEIPGASEPNKLYAIPAMELAAGVYAVQVYFNGKLYAVEKLIVLK